MSDGVGRVAGDGIGKRPAAGRAAPEVGGSRVSHGGRRCLALFAGLCSLLLLGTGATPAAERTSAPPAITTSATGTAEQAPNSHLPTSATRTTQQARTGHLPQEAEGRQDQGRQAEDRQDQGRQAKGEAPTQAASLAALLRSDPVYVTDQLPREIPRSTAPEFAKLAKRTGVPTYVLVLPDQGTDAERLLAAVHDRLGRDGLYVLVDDMGVAGATAFGVRAPADDASTVALYELPYDAGPLLSFERFTDVIALGGKKAAERADTAREEHERTGGDEPEMHIDPVDRDNQSFVTGIALTGVPLLIICVSPYVRRWWRRRPGATARVDGKAAAPRRLTARLLTARRVEAGAAALAAAAIALGATLVFDQKTSSAAPAPIASDLSSRVDRVADGLRERGPLYSDPESPHPLDSTQTRELTDRIKKFDRGPVFVALVPQLTEDESEGEPELFLEAVRQKIGAKGERGVYVVADPLGGTIDVVTYDVRVDADLVGFDLSDAIRYGDDDDRSTDHQLGKRLDALMTLLDKAPRTDQPETSSLGMDDAPDPVEENRLAPLFSGDFWPGLMVGAVAAGLVFGVVAALLGILGRAVPSLRRSRAAAAVTPSADTSFQAPPDPSPDYLRRTARDELDALGREFDPDAALRSSVRTRVWDCLDTATLLVDRDPDGHVDDDATSADLAAAVVLARAGRAALAGIDKPCCALNPLHGPATGWRDALWAPEDQRLRTLPVCAECRVLVGVQPRLAYTLRLTIPGAGSGAGRRERVPYEEAPGPLSAARDGLPQLIRKVREYAGVQ
ncbi:hypothetical protein ACFWPU_15430 [Streptomyces sp. NPDC058471]|uniref:hypothetical protein n=1 Tax=Streptomyces sp. NPDC058471 TaxID=3346516 RepID=UPI003652C02B